MTPPVFAHGHLRLYLLSLLAVRPMHGYDLMQALSERFGGTYTPSAGTIYPRLSKLEDEGLVSKEVEGRKTVYAITDAGRAELAGRESELDSIESELSDSVRRLADEVRSSVEGAMKSLRADLAAAARDARDDARGSGTTSWSASGQEHPGFDSRDRLRDAEAVLTEFRSAIRVELRRAATRNALDERAVSALTAGLEKVRRDVLDALRRD